MEIKGGTFRQSFLFIEESKKAPNIKKSSKGAIFHLEHVLERGRPNDNHHERTISGQVLGHHHTQYMHKGKHPQIGKSL